MEKIQLSQILWIIAIILLIWFLIDLFSKQKFYEGLDSPGQSCILDFQCASKACGFPNWGAYKMECCPSNKTNIFAGRTYCKMQKGMTCFTNDMCESDQCNNGTCQ